MTSHRGRAATHRHVRSRSAHRVTHSAAHHASALCKGKRGEKRERNDSDEEAAHGQYLGSPDRRAFPTPTHIKMRLLRHRFQELKGALAKNPLSTFPVPLQEWQTKDLLRRGPKLKKKRNEDIMNQAICSWSRSNEIAAEGRTLRAEQGKGQEVSAGKVKDGMVEIGVQGFDDPVRALGH
jgi:hypothetical protein